MALALRGGRFGKSYLLNRRRFHSAAADGQDSVTVRRAMQFGLQAEHVRTLA